MITKQDIEKYYTVHPTGAVNSRNTVRQFVGKVDRYGYRVLCLSLDCGVKHIPVHRLVAICHLTGSGSQINHKDGDKLNNDVSNLEWCTPQENTQHAYDNGLATAWNKGKTGVYSEEQLGRMKVNQPNRKPVMASNGVDEYKYDSLRAMCEEMGFDRRIAMRVLKGEANYNSIKGFKINYQ